MGSHSVTCHPAEVTFQPLPQPKPVLGWGRGCPVLCRTVAKRFHGPIKLGTVVGVIPGHIVLDGDPPPRPKGAQPPIFGPYLLCPNGSMDQDATWYGGRPRPRRHCVRWGPAPLPKRGGTAAPTFPPMYCGQTTGWIKMPLGTEVGLGPGHTVLDGDPAHFRPMSVVAKRLNGSKGHLARRQATASDIVLHGDPAPPNGHNSPLFSAHVYCGQTVTHLSYC